MSPLADRLCIVPAQSLLQRAFKSTEQTGNVEPPVSHQMSLFRREEEVTAENLPRYVHADGGELRIHSPRSSAVQIEAAMI